MLVSKKEKKWCRGFQVKCKRPQAHSYCWGPTSYPLRNFPFLYKQACLSLYFPFPHKLKGTSQVALVVKNPPANAGDIRDLGLILSWEDSLEEEMATHSRILACENPMDRRAWQATVHSISKSWTVLKQLSTHAHKLKRYFNTVLQLYFSFVYYNFLFLYSL